MIQKLSATSNAITWFEIPAKDIRRARAFYETVFDIKMETLPGGDPKEESVFFPRQPDTIMAQSGIVSGALVKAKRIKPGLHGVLIYLNAYPSIQPVIDKIAPAGGMVIQGKTKIPAGFIAVFMDTEGNQLGLHAQE